MFIQSLHSAISVTIVSPQEGAGVWLRAPEKETFFPCPYSAHPAVDTSGVCQSSMSMGTVLLRTPEPDSIQLSEVETEYILNNNSVIANADEIPTHFHSPSQAPLTLIA